MQTLFPYSILKIKIPQCYVFQYHLQFSKKKKIKTCFMWHITCKNHTILDFKERLLNILKSLPVTFPFFYSAAVFPAVVDSTLWPGWSHPVLWVFTSSHGHPLVAPHQARLLVPLPHRCPGARLMRTSCCLISNLSNCVSCFHKERSPLTCSLYNPLRRYWVGSCNEGDFLKFLYPNLQTLCSKSLW